MSVLEKIRVKLGILITVLIAVALLSFIIDPQTLETTMRFFSSKYDVGKIDGKKIGYEDFQKEMEYYTNIYKLTTGSQSIDERANETIKETAWQNLVSESYMIPQFRKAGIRVCEDEIVDMSQGKEISPVLAQERAFLDASGNYSREKLLDFIHAIPQDASGNLGMYWEFLQRSMTNQQYFIKYSSLFSQSNVITPVELRRQIEENNTTSDVKFVLYPIGFRPDTTIKVSDNEIRDYYNAHKKNYKRGASRDVEFVAFEVEPSEKDIQLAKERIDGLYEEFTRTSNLKTFLARNSDKPLNTYYYKEGELKSSFPQVEEFAFGKNPTVLPVFRKDNDFYAARVSDVKNLPDSVFVQHILLRSGSDNLADSLANVIRKGSDFSLLASEYSLDTNPNVENPGDLGWLTQTYMVPGMESILSYNPGDVKVLNTNYGTHVVKVTKRTKPMKKVQVALLVIESVAGKETYQSYYAQANDLIIRSEGNITKFNEVAREGNLPIVPVSNVKEGASTLSKYKNTKEISRWIYEAKEGDVSPLFTVDNDKYFVVALKKVKEEGYTPIQEVSAQIKYLLTNKKRSEKVSAEVAEKIAGLTSIDAVAAALGQSVSTKEDIAFGIMSGAANEPAFLGAVAGATPNTLSGPVAGNAGIYVFSVVNRETGSFYTDSDAKIRANQIQSYQINSLPSILSEMANIVDNRARFF